MTAAEGRCPVEVWERFHHHTCNRPIKRDGMCGVHAAARERSLANQRKRDAQYAASARTRDEVERFLIEHGVQGTVHYTLQGDSDGKVVVSVRELRRLMQLD